MLKFFRIQKKAVGMAISSEIAYRMNFYIKCFAMVLSDFIGPMLTLIIYSTTLGIPGWTLHEFLLFQGTLILVFGMAHTFIMHFPYEVMHSIREGEFDKYLVKPYNTLLYILAESFDMEGLAEVTVGIIIIAYSMVKLGLSVFSLNFLLFLVLVAAGFVVQAAMMIFISSLAFLVVRSEALLNLYYKISDFVRYPLNVYAVSIQLFLTFLFPLAVSSFYPADVLLRGATVSTMLSVLIPVAIFTAVSVFLWNIAMKRYTSAGG